MGVETEDVRYGRARLTVARSGSLLADDELGRALERHERGDAPAEEVAWAYVRTRTVDHSPSFAWKEARLGPLIELVTGVSDSPKLEAKTPAELITALTAERRRERGPEAPAEAEPSATPASATAPPVASEKPKPPPAPPKRRFGFLPRTWPARVALGLGVVLLVAMILGIRYYLNEVPDQLADDYRDDAQPATEKITDAMDRAFAAYDTYLDDSTLPRSQIQNADGIEEIKRRFLPLYDDTEEALDTGEKAIENAHKVIKKQRAEFDDVPSSPFLGEKAPVVEAEETIELSERYVIQAEKFLRNFERFIRFDRRALALRREEIEKLGGEQLSADASIEEVKASLNEDLVEAKQNLSGYQELEPHPDQEKLHDVQTELSAIAVDYLEDILAAYNALSIPQLRAADDEYIAEFRPLRDQESYFLALFASDSSLQKQSRAVERLGNRLEEHVAGLGTGDGEIVRPDRYRPPPPPAPRKPEGGSGGDEGQSQA